MIRLEGICKSYETVSGSLQVLKDITMTVEEGEFIAVLGSSGSGKSTLMNVIGCMDQWDTGEYFLDNIPIHDYKKEQLTKVRNEKIGFIFQKYQLIPTYNVLQNMIMPLLVRGMKRQDAIQQAEELMKQLNLSERSTHKPAELSGGQQQRVAIARALIGKPAILLADEPTGALDSQTGKDVMELFQKLHQQGHTIVMITHDKHIASYATRIIELEDGRIVSH